MTDEQTDDLQGFPTSGVGENLDRRAVVIPHEPRTPPCTGYEADYERIEQAEREAGRR